MFCRCSDWFRLVLHRIGTAKRRRKRRFDRGWSGQSRCILDKPNHRARIPTIMSVSMDLLGTEGKVSLRSGTRCGTSLCILLYIAAAGSSFAGYLDSQRKGAKMQRRKEELRHCVSGQESAHTTNIGNEPRRRKVDLLLNCNRDAIAGFAAAHGLGHLVMVSTITNTAAARQQRWRNDSPSGKKHVCSPVMLRCRK